MKKIDAKAVIVAQKIFELIERHDFQHSHCNINIGSGEFPSPAFEIEYTGSSTYRTSEADPEFRRFRDMMMKELKIDAVGEGGNEFAFERSLSDAIATLNVALKKAPRERLI